MSLIQEIFSDQCPTTEDEQPVYYPHETNCSLFYQCSYGRLMLMTCPGMLYFNKKLNVCDQSYNVNCTLTTEGPLTTDVITTTEFVTCTQGLDTKEPVVTTEGKVETTTLPNNIKCTYDTIYYQIPYPEDCTRYIICNYGKPEIGTCPEGKHFDTIDSVCKNKEEAVCNGSIFLFRHLISNV